MTAANGTCYYCGDPPSDIRGYCNHHLPTETLLEQLTRYGYALSDRAHRLNREARVVGEAITRLRLGENDRVILAMLAKAGVTPS